MTGAFALRKAAAGQTPLRNKILGSIGIAARFGGTQRPFDYSLTKLTDATRTGSRLGATRHRQGWASALPLCPRR